MQLPANFNDRQYALGTRLSELHSTPAAALLGSGLLLAAAHFRVEGCEKQECFPRTVAYIGTCNKLRLVSWFPAFVTWQQVYYLHSE